MSIHLEEMGDTPDFLQRGRDQLVDLMPEIGGHIAIVPSHVLVTSDERRLCNSSKTTEWHQTYTPESFQRLVH
jgi:hypothetical protein